MAFAGINKSEIVKKFKRNATDTGSPEVQVALLTSRLEGLKAHFDFHKKDMHSMRGLLGMVARRKSLLNYLKTENHERYKALLSSLNLRK